MKAIEIPLLGPHSESRSISISDQETINLHLEDGQPGSKGQLSLYSNPGLRLVTTAGNGSCRCNPVVFKGSMYSINGDKFVKIDVGYGATELGTINTSVGRVHIVAGRDYVAFVDGVDGWTFDGAAFAQITDADFPVATHIAYLDSYFIVNKVDSDQWHISAQENPTAWNAADFTAAESRPDDVTGVYSTLGQLYLTGDLTTEVFFNSGNADFPFDRYPNGVIDWAIEAKDSAARYEGGIVFLGKTEQGAAQVVSIKGLTAQVISTPDFEWEISKLVKTDDAFAYIVKYSGRTFYEIHFPLADRSYAVDLKKGYWHRKKSLNKGRHLGAGHVFFNKNHVIGDYNSNNYYEYDWLFHKDNTDLITRSRKTQIVHKEEHKIIMHSIEIVVEAGTGITSGLGSDPQFLLRKSTDGGYNWSSLMSRSIGKIGERRARLIYRNIGSARNWSFEMQSSDPTNLTIIKAVARLTVAQH